MKKSCYGCKALVHTSGSLDGWCMLNFKINTIEGGYSHYFKPAEQCPKPTTYQKYFDCNEEIKKERGK